MRLRLNGHTPTKVLGDDSGCWESGCAELLSEPLCEGLAVDPRVRLLILTGRDVERRRLELEQRALLHDPQRAVNRRAPLLRASGLKGWLAAFDSQFR